MEVKTAQAVLKIAFTLISLFSLDNIQAKEVETYAKAHANAWVLKRKEESEVRSYIENYIYEIKD